MRFVGDGAGVVAEWYEAPTFYFTNPYAVTGPYDDVPVPPGSAMLDFELEVAAVVGRDGASVPPEQAPIFGYTIMNDWSARDLQRREMKVSLGPAAAPDPEADAVSVVAITGAGQGQGAAEARLLAARGVTVIATDRTAAPAEDLGGAEYRQLDVTDQAGWAGFAQDLAERRGRVHGLVANAGVTWRARLLDVTPDDLRRVHEVNVKSISDAMRA